MDDERTPITDLQDLLLQEGALRERRRVLLEVQNLAARLRWHAARSSDSAMQQYAAQILDHLYDTVLR
jgi:hypothetical protein